MEISNTILGFIGGFILALYIYYEYSQSLKYKHICPICEEEHWRKPVKKIIEQKNVSGYTWHLLYSFNSAWR